MKPRDLDFLRRLIAEQPERRTHGASAAYLCEHEGIGKIKGASVQYTPVDFERARNLLTSRGFDVEPPATAFLRSEAPRGGSEKTGALRVSEDLVAVAPINCPPISIPAGSMLALTVRDALQLPFEVLLVCENMEPMLQLHTFTWLETFTKGRSVLALFRGAPGFFRTDTAARLIAQDTRPTLAFFDFDPKGLSMAASLPRREALCLPPWSDLERAVVQNRRAHLFSNSLHASRPHLERQEEGDIASAWTQMKVLSLGLDQEHFPR